MRKAQVIGLSSREAIFNRNLGESMVDLKSMLDFTEFKNVKDIEHHFYKIAQHLFYNYELQTKSDQALKITDLELYIYHGDGFKDEEMHKHHSQMTSGRFYVHRHHQNQSVFKKPSHIGIDITCGSPFSCYGGILIRETKKGDEFLSCSKTVLELIGSQYTDLRRKRWDESEVALLHKLDDSSVFNGPAIIIDTPKVSNDMPVWTARRKAVSDKNPFLKHQFRAISCHSSKSIKKLELVSHNLKKAA